MTPRPADKAQELLARYAAAAALPADHKARLLDVVNERVARGDVPRFDVQAPAPVVPEPALLEQLWASAWGKAGLAMLALGLPTTGFYALRDAPEPAVPPAALGPARSVASLPVPASEAAGALPSTELRVEPPAVRPRDAQGARPERAAALPSASEPTIDEEVRLLNAAQKALQGGQPERALSLLSEHAGRFPQGKLTSARQVTRMLALCQAGQAERARQEAKQFVAQSPASPLVDRVKTICASEAKER